MQLLNNNIDQLLDKFRSASLADLEKLALLDRYDTKYIVPVSLLLEILPRFLEDYSILEIDGKRDFEYFNQYFDTPSYAFYTAHHNGKRNRMKIRYRNYKDTGMAFLEIKRKINNETQKDRIKYSTLSFDFNSVAESFINKTNEVNADELVPKLQVSYRRITLMNPNTKDKITIDRNLYFKNTVHDYQLDEVALIEVKTKKQSQMAFPIQLLKEMMIRNTNVSKYCLGLVLTRSNVKYNRFKKNILTINNLTKDNNDGF